MPRVTRQRTKFHKSDISSAPVLLEQQDEPETRTKKTKRIERHKKWMEKIDAAQGAKKERQRQEGRATSKSALIRGLGNMQESLRDIQAQVLAKGLLSLDEKKEGSTRKNNNGGVPKSRKARNNAAIKEEKRFGQVLLHPAFQANPLATIRQHLANTLGSDSSTGSNEHKEDS
ncbi:hypothetical protein IW140_004308 [Coemansia sp. RSA 1813]|nr:hypothetical protein EV178_004381 [Coemansia sp. RSA 1646]KAJ1767398.1 hypothetical protein LPJ74_005390 [Coemansia sp. RSA 1843]KAJ2087960.1 hypothetical protein IW138_004557 [Coemansia sp. RSA 986]KAJ2211272.1 hypothetical protein EV179_005636 [Coemansia sp. RSA 487]KAJ2567798.1 hypothetical protein IW140_004308 [Coemansia sp. RSA 1813]